MIHTNWISLKKQEERQCCLYPVYILVVTLLSTVEKDIGKKSLLHVTLKSLFSSRSLLSIYYREININLLAWFHE